VMTVLLGLETEQAPRRQLTKALAELFVEELEEADDALALLLDHLEKDPADASARQDAENIGFASGQIGAVFDAWSQLREVDDPGLAALYAERLADVAQRAGDIERTVEALEHLVARQPDDASLWERLQQIYDYRNDAEGVARCL